MKAKEQSIRFSNRLLFFRNLIAVFVAFFIILIIRSNLQKTSLNKQLKKQNDAIALQKEEISNQKEDLSRLNYTKDQLFSVISHDLRSPFTSILQLMDFIFSGEISPSEQDIILKSFHQQVSLVSVMMNNLLTWANSQQTGIKSNAAIFDIVDVTEEIVALSKFLAKNKNIHIDHFYDERKLVYTDPDHSKIIIQNLISNAVKFTPNGGSIKIYYTEEEHYQVLHVKDNGIGIAPEKMEKLFKVTGKEISGYGTDNETGAGIGLALIKQFVDANNGKITVKSVTGQGTEFRVYLMKAEHNMLDFIISGQIAEDQEPKIKEDKLDFEVY